MTSDGARDHADTSDGAVEADSKAAQARVGRLAGIRERAQQRRSTRVAWRTTVTIAGVVIVAAGLTMLILPGPGWGAIILGIVLLASEYEWARRALRPVKRGVSRAMALGKHPRVRVAVWVLVVFATAALIGFGIWYVVRFGWTWRGVPTVAHSIRSWLGL